jgi:hypothetical protein
VKGKTPEGQNPKSVTRLKMVGRQWREKVAERLKKPEGDTVAGKWEVPVESRLGKGVGELKRATVEAVDLRCLMR